MTLQASDEKTTCGTTGSVKGSRRLKEPEWRYNESCSDECVVTLEEVNLFFQKRVSTPLIFIFF